MKDHEAEMKALQKEMRGKMAAARRRKGLIIVHTGDGKGKTSAALGMLLRSLGHGFKCAVVQFIKGGRGTAESLLKSPRLRWDKVGQGFTWDTQSREKDTQCARAGWELVRRHLADPELKFLLLDELNIVLVQYAYTNNLLTQVTDRDGHITKYHYNSDKLLDSITLPRS